MTVVFSYTVRLVIFQCAIGMKIVNTNSSDTQLENTRKIQSTRNYIENLPIGKTFHILFSEPSDKDNVSSTPKLNGFSNVTEAAITSSVDTASSTKTYSCVINKDCFIYNHAWCSNNRCVCKIGYVWSRKRDVCIVKDSEDYNVIMTGVAISAVMLILLFSGCYIKRTMSSHHSSPVNQTNSYTDGPLSTVSGITSAGFGDLAALDKPPTYDEFLNYKFRSQPFIPEDLPPPSYQESFLSISSTASSSALAGAAQDGLCQSEHDLLHYSDMVVDVMIQRTDCENTAFDP
ncbi:uncharacterized protein LOC143253703 isoform X2 [Tachypleus tridentatus]|uniref:uncharacterized protein LOC143253703 isoform X2 n=1 Tax=Tachypleus tridentatus TaxID=6853 RepID=UPI003FD2AEA3